MSNFQMYASEYMSTPIVAVGLSTSVVDADRLIADKSISALGVRSEAGDLVGVVSRTDLLESSSAESGETFRLSDEPVERVMTPDPITVPGDTPLSKVARIMLDERIHRVFVKGRSLEGVVSTRDLVRAVADKRTRTAAHEIATRSIVRVTPDDSVALAVERLERSNRHGLVVADRGWPVGTFSQRDALLARAVDPRTRVEDVMNTRILALPPLLPLYRVAVQALAMNARRILLMDETAIVGVVSSYDFARVVR